MANKLAGGVVFGMKILFFSFFPDSFSPFLPSPPAGVTAGAVSFWISCDGQPNATVTAPFAYPFRSATSSMLIGRWEVGGGGGGTSASMAAIGGKVAGGVGGRSGGNVTGRDGVGGRSYLVGQLVFGGGGGAGSGGANGKP